MASLSVSLSVVKNCEHSYLHVHVMASLFLALKETPIVHCVASRRLECCWRALTDCRSVSLFCYLCLYQSLSVIKLKTVNTYIYTFTLWPPSSWH
jgi:hypothetical protein